MVLRTALLLVLMLVTLSTPGGGLPGGPVGARPAAGWHTARWLTASEGHLLAFDLHHVQGLVVTAEAFFISSVDRWSSRGWLYKVDRRTRALLQRRELTAGRLVHPGGLSFDGRYVWIPNAEYDPGGPTRVQAHTPDGLAVVSSFVVDDHVSLVASDGQGRLYGTDWNSRHFFVWDTRGRLLARVPSPTGIAYQDCEVVAPHLVCGGTRGLSGVIDVLDPATWRLVNRVRVGRTSSGRLLTREGLAFAGQRLYVLPEDGMYAAILGFDLHE